MNHSISLWKLSTTTKVGTTLRLGPDLCTVFVHFHHYHLVFWTLKPRTVWKPPFLLL